MKYLESFDNRNIKDAYEELSEYLQEIFDKYSIKKHINKSQSYPLMDKTITWEIIIDPLIERAKWAYLIIHNIPDDYNMPVKLSEIIYYELRKAKPNIEKRLRKEIIIELNTTTSMPIHWITIHILGFRKTILKIDL